MAEQFFYHPNTDLKGVALTLWNSEVLLPTWYQADGWFVSGSTLVDTSLSGVPGSGFVAAFPGTSADAWAVQFSGSFINFAANQAVTSYAAPSGAIFGGGCLVSGAPYAVDSTSGTLYAVVSGAVHAVSGAFGSTPARALGLNGSTLYTLLPSVSGVGSMALSGPLTGTSGFVAAPFDMVASLAVSGTNIAVGGWNNVSFASGYAGLAIEPGTNLELLAVRSAALDIYTTTGNSAWTLNQTISGLGNGSSVAWSPDDRFGFTTEPTSGVVRVFTNTVGVLALTQTLAAPNANVVAITTDSQNGLVAETAGNLLAALSVSGSVWSIGSTVSIPKPSALLALGATSMAAGYASGIAYLSLVVSTWSVSSSATLGFLPLSLAVDAAGIIYAAGTIGASGAVAAVSGTTVISSGTWAGTGTDIFYEQGQIVVLDPTNNLARVWGSVSGVLSAQSTRSIASGAQAIAGAGVDVFISGAASTSQYLFGGPYELKHQRAGQVSVYNGSIWNSFALGVTGIPEAITWSPSGHVTIVTLQNNQVTITSGATLVSSGVIPQAAGQAQSVPLGISSLLWVGSSLYASTGMNDALIQVA